MSKTGFSLNVLPAEPGDLDGDGAAACKHGRRRRLIRSEKVSQSILRISPLRHMIL